ncbi:MAG: hypothetical protein R3Y12_09025 [Clostridia bacterium]
MKKFNILYAIGIPSLFWLLIIFAFTCNSVLKLDLPAEILAYLLIIGFVGFLATFFVHGFIYKSTIKKMDKQLATMQINQVFNGQSVRVAIDQTNNKIVLTFAYNPSKIYTLPLSSITKAQTNDFKHGSGFLEGTMRVAFQFWIDGQKVTVDTFTSSRQKFRMDSNEVLTGIAKADAMVEILSAHLVK